MAIYGVTFDGVSSAGTRTDNAVGMGWERSTNEIAGQDDFAAVAPFNVRECVTTYNSGTGQRDVLGYKGDAGYDALRADITNDIMIEFPIFWYQRPSKYTFRVSDSPTPGFKPSPMHHHKGRIYKYVRISKYAPNNDYISQVGTYPRVSTNMNTFRTNFRAKGQYLMDYSAWCSVTILSLIKYANMNVQNTVGQGASSGNATVLSGAADSVLGLDGSPGSVDATPLSVVIHGVENFYGNVNKYVDGLFSYENYAYVRDVIDISADPANSSELESSYTKIDTAIASGGSNSAISDIAFDSLYNFAMFPTALGTPNPSGDACWTGSGLNCVLMGEDAWNGAAGGLFSYRGLHAVGFTYYDFGAMSMEFGEQYPQKQLYIASDNKVYAMATV